MISARVRKVSSAYSSSSSIEKGQGLQQRCPIPVTLEHSWPPPFYDMILYTTNIDPQLAQAFLLAVTAGPIPQCSEKRGRRGKGEESTKLVLRTLLAEYGESTGRRTRARRTIWAKVAIPFWLQINYGAHFATLKCFFPFIVTTS